PGSAPPWASATLPRSDDVAWAKTDNVPRQRARAVRTRILQLRRIKLTSEELEGMSWRRTDRPCLQKSKAGAAYAPAAARRSNRLIRREFSAFSRRATRAAA